LDAIVGHPTTDVGNGAILPLDERAAVMRLSIGTALAKAVDRHPCQ